MLSFLAWGNGRAEIWEHSYNIHLKVACIILSFIYVSRYYLVFLYLEMQTFVINCAMGNFVVVVVTFHDYIGYNNVFLGFATSLLMSLVSCYGITKDL